MPAMISRRMRLFAGLSACMARSYEQGRSVWACLIIPPRLTRLCAIQRASILPPCLLPQRPDRPNLIP
jgi:hypothetical protein